MYAAAGGASLASRQARAKQRQNKKAQVKTTKASDLSRPQKQFHNYTEEDAVRGLSRIERNALRAPQPAAHDRRHSASHYHLKEPPRARIRESPSISIPVQNHHQPAAAAQPLSPTALAHNHMPALHASPSLASQLPQIFVPEGDGKLERRCSFVRQVEEMEKCQEGGVLDRCNHMCNFEIKDKAWVNNHQTFYSEYDHFGSLDYPFSECSQGRAAWQERGRRCSISEEARQHRIRQTDAHHRWMKRNRIHDATYGGSSEEDDFLSVYHQSAAANALLYVGLGTTAIGSVIFFVGTGEKGFKTLELRLIGPTLIACGLLCCLIRVLLCACPSTCLRRRKKTRLLKHGCPHSESRFPLAPHRKEDSDFMTLDKAFRQKKKVCIAPTKQPVPSTSATDFQKSRDFEPPPEKPAPQPLLPIPTIELPDFGDEANCPAREDSVIELQALELCYDLQSVSSGDSEGQSGLVACKLAKPRTPANGDDSETCLSVVVETRECALGGTGETNRNRGERHSGVVLSPLQLGQ